jgi:hypothetical protein
MAAERAGRTDDPNREQSPITMPQDLGVVDLMIGFPSADAQGKYGTLRELAKDAESKERQFPAEYMFKEVPIISTGTTTPRAIIDYANSRGAEKIMYAGYYPMGLSLERIFTELPDVPFRDHVWALFLRDNERRVFHLNET